MIHCTFNFHNRSLELFEGEYHCGCVVELEDDVQIRLRPTKQQLTFNEIAIIQDNWNELQEALMRQQKCPDCGLDKSTCPC